MIGGAAATSAAIAIEGSIWGCMMGKWRGASVSLRSLERETRSVNIPRMHELPFSQVVCDVLHPL